MLDKKAFSLLLLLVVSTFCYASSEESTSSSSHEEDTSGEQEGDTSMNKAFEELIDNFEGYADVKEAIVQKIAEQLGKGTVNITIIGWQNIHDDKGNLKGINTLELGLPSKDSVEDDTEVEFEGDYDSLVQEIEATREILEDSTLQDANVEETLYREMYSSDGSEEYFQIVMNKDETYASLGAVASCYNKTVRNIKNEDVQAFAKLHENKHAWGVCTLSYDEGGNFLPEMSQVEPSLTVTVKNIEDDAPLDFIDAVVKVFANVAVQYPAGDISEELYFALTKKLPEYIWNVIESPDTYYITRDYGLLLTYDPTELEYRSEYYVYANKVKKQSE